MQVLGSDSLVGVGTFSAGLFDRLQITANDIRVIAVGQLAKGQQEEQEAAEEQEEPRSLTGSSRASSSSIRM